MRLAALEFLAYGAFAGERLAFPAGARDLHLVYGPNAAGKSTARTAIGDALFGFPARTAMAFAVDQRQLRIGFTLERDGAVLQAVRRKGTKRTLLAPDGETPLDDTLLASWVGPVGRERFERAFALDDVQLRRGGEAMLSGGDDLAGLVFGAASGLTGLSERIAALEARADAAWGTTRKRSRRAEVAHERFLEATRTLKDRRLLAPAYRGKVERLQTVEAALTALRTERRRLQEAAASAQLALRVLDPLDRLARAEAALAELGDPPLLPIDATERLAAAVRRLAEIDQAAALHDTRRRAIVAELASLPETEPLLELSGAIDAFADQAAVVASQDRLRPSWEHEAEAAAAACATALRAAGLPPATALPPTASAIDAAAALYAERETLTKRRETLRVRRDAKAAAHAQRTAALADLPAGGDVDRLAAAAEAFRAWCSGGIDPVHARDAAALAADRLTEALDRLAPWRGAAAALRLADLPAPEAERELSAEAARLASRRETLTARQDGLRAEAEALALRRRTLADAGPVVETAQVIAARNARDAAWRRFRDATAAGGPPHTMPPAAAVEHAIHRADELADTRFAAATRISQLEGVEAGAARLDRDRAAVDAEAASVAAAAAAVADRWAALTAATPMAGVTLADAAPWRRDAALAIERRIAAEDAARSAARADAASAEVRAGLIAALAAHGVDVPTATTATQLATLADVSLERLRERVAARAAQVQDLRVLEAEIATLDADATDAAAALAASEDPWWAALGGLALDPARLPASIPVLLEGLQLAHRHHVTAVELRTRIDRAAAEARALVTEAARLAAAVGLEPAAPERLKAALLTARSEAARRLERRDRLRTEVLELDAESARLDAARRALLAELEPLQACAGVRDLAALGRAAEASDARRRWADAVASERSSLARLAPGSVVGQLQALVAGRNSVALGVAADEAAAALAATDERLESLQRDAVTARLDLDALDTAAGSAAAATAESERQQAAAAMARAIEDHLEGWLTARLLRRALDDYRAANETPLLQRASAAFAALTLGEFVRLTVDYGHADGVLVAVRPDGAWVERSGLSAGTRDQLYLALRLAALDLYLDRAPPLPFVVDDVLIQFSDDRAAVALRYLARLADRTQVLVFTHHRHVVELAAATLGEDGFTLHRLENRLPRAATGSGGEGVAEGVARVGQDGLDRDPALDVDEDRRP